MNDSPLKAFVFASIKFSRLQASQQTANRYGLARSGRKVLDELPADLASAPVQEPDDCRSTQQREVLMGFIREYSSDPDCRELIVRTAVNGECITTVAEQMGVNPSTARSVLKRFRKFLGIGD